jgi:hypothetical protein
MSLGGSSASHAPSQELAPAADDAPHPAVVVAASFLEQDGAACARVRAIADSAQAEAEAASACARLLREPSRWLVASFADGRQLCLRDDATECAVLSGGASVAAFAIAPPAADAALPPDVLQLLTAARAFLRNVLTVPEQRTQQAQAQATQMPQPQRRQAQAQQQQAQQRLV